MKHIINNESLKALKFGDFCSKWYFEIRSHKTMGKSVEVKAFGYHLRWYVEDKFFFIRRISDMKMLVHS